MMFRRPINDIALLKKSHPRFFLFSVFVLVLYAAQLLIKTEITPLGYFSLYSNAMEEQASYHQILPFDTVNKKLINIYQAKGTGFLMLEILPTRYDILSKSDHCNQMNHKLRRIGLGDNNFEDCQKLSNFNSWMTIYGQRQGFNLSPTILVDCGFKDGQLIEMNRINATKNSQ
ncbi:MAG: hypothetical protein IT245_01765 [Bacteroidia bacterium]|nr:hypothetical protein [Bacteroidia bacterium]